ncbi:MAG TPA: EAL domain-containing protein [Solirubrobacteraceae bacterium]|nr:EAL domain-containing protein [Solirubrobacteraceae bacterium]
MSSSNSTNGTPKVSVRTPPAPRHRRWSCPPADASGGNRRSQSTPAGLHGRPWVARLRRALERDSFELHFQPIVSLRHGGISHYEALLRLADVPGGELIAPGAFLPAAERYGLISEIDRMVLARVARMLGRDRTLGEVTIAMNVSALSVTDPGMLGYIAATLARHEVDPSRLAIEITETAAISDMVRAKAFCGGVLDLGCALALDDFGAGFGSFQYLKQLPFSHLKIDGDFIRNLPSSPTDQLVVRALARIVKGMGRETIAEFVGDQPTMAMLRAYDVDYAQGYEVGMPAPMHASAVEAPRRVA